MRFGIAIPNDAPPGTDPSRHVDEVIRQAIAAEDLGYESVWVLHHYLSNMPTLQPVPLLAALARETTSIRLGTNILILPLHHPVAVAEQFATLDHLSEGRAIGGFGLGYRENEFAAFGIDIDERIGRFTEGMQILRELMTGERVDFAGEHFALEGAQIHPPPLQQPFPLWVGAGAHRAGARRAARLGDAWILPPHTRPATIASVVETHDAELERLGRLDRRRVVVRREVLLRTDPDEAFDRGVAVRSRLSRRYASYGAPNATGDYRHLAGADSDAELRAVAAGAYLFTDPDGCVRGLRVLEESGVTDVIVRMRWFDMPLAEALASMETFAQEVAPRFLSPTGPALPGNHEHDSPKL